ENRKIWPKSFKLFRPRRFRKGNKKLSGDPLTQGWSTARRKYRAPKSKISDLAQNWHKHTLGLSEKSNGPYKQKAYLLGHEHNHELPKISRKNPKKLPQIIPKNFQKRFCFTKL